MRTILGIALLLVSVGLMSCRIEGYSTGPPISLSHVDWVRTIDGWERSHRWTPSLASPPAVHPLVVAAAQVLISLFALAAASVETPVPGRQVRGPIRQPRFAAARVPTTAVDQRRS